MKISIKDHGDELIGLAFDNPEQGWSFVMGFPMAVIKEIGELLVKGEDGDIELGFRPKMLN